MSTSPVPEPTQAELDAKMLSELRHEAKVMGLGGIRITPEELDMLLRIADERDRLIAEHVQMPDDPDMRPVASIMPIPAGYMLIGGELLPLPSEPDRETVVQPRPATATRYATVTEFPDGRSKMGPVSVCRVCGHPHPEGGCRA